MTERRVFSQPSQASLRMQRSWSSSSSVTSSPNGTPFSSPVKAPMSTKSSMASFAMSASLKEREEEADEIIMFSGPDIRLMQFATFRKHSDYDSPPDRHNCWKESTVAKGDFEVYKMLGKKAAYMRCQGFVHPILPKLRMWRTEWNEFVLPQPIPEKYWRIILPTGDGYDEFMGPNLEQVFQGTCSYKCVMPPPQPPSPPPEIDEMDESEESSMVETLRDIKHGTADSSFADADDHSELPTLSGIVTPEYRPFEEQSAVIFEDELRSKFLDMQMSTPPVLTFDVSSEEEQDESFEQEEQNIATQQVPQSNVFELTDEDPYSSSSSTLDRVLDFFESSDDNDTLTIAPAPLDSISNPENPSSTASLDSTDTNTNTNTTITHHEEETAASSPALSSVSTAVFQTPDPSEQEPALTLSPPSTARKSYMNHPLVPLATRNNILSSTYPIRFKPMEDDWLEVSGGTIPAYQFMAPNGKPGYMSWASQVTNDLVSSSSNYLSDKMEKMTLASAAYVPKLGASHPQSYWHKDYAVPSPTSDTLSTSSSRIIRDGSPVSHLRQRSLSTSSIQSMIGTRRQQQEFPEVPDFYHQAATVSGYVGWRLWNKVSPWAKRT